MSCLLLGLVLCTICCHHITCKTVHVSNEDIISTLQYYLCANGSAMITNNTIIIVSSRSAHNLDSGPICVVKNIHNLTVASDHPVDTANITCNNGDGRALGFFNISGLRLQNLRFQHCSGLIASPTIMSMINGSRVFFPTHQKAVFLISWCEKVTVIGVTIHGTYVGYAMIMVNPSGQIHVNGTEVSRENLLTEVSRQNMKECGSGVVFLYTACTEYNTNETQLLITESNFNNIHDKTDYEENDPIGLIQSGVMNIPIFGGTGLTLLFIENSPRTTSVESTEIYNNEGIYGGSCLIFMYNVNKTELKLQNVAIAHNRQTDYHSKGSGLALYILANKQGSVSLNMNAINFYNNTNDFIGGGWYIFITNYLGYVVNIHINSSYFYANVAKNKGSALYIEREYYTSKPLSHVFIVIMNSVLYSNGNSHMHIPDVKTMYSRLASTIELIGLQNITINMLQAIRNINTVLVLKRTKLNITGKISFEGTKTCSEVMLKDKSTISFLPNTLVSILIGQCAPLNLGSITAYSVVNGCPIKFDDQAIVNVSFSWQYNFEYALYVLYFSEMTKCDRKNLKEHIIVSGERINPVYIYSPATVILNCAVNNNNSEFEAMMSVYPGAYNTLYLKAGCYGNSSCYMMSHLQFLQNTKGYVQLRGSDVKQRVYSNQCVSLQFQILFHNYTQTSRVTLWLVAYNQMTALKRISDKFINIALKSCPLGFMLDLTVGSCVCHPILQAHHEFFCNISLASISIPPLAWVGEVLVNNDSVFGYSLVSCPPLYCKNNISQVIMTEKDSVCSNYRTGVLCGQCIDGYSVIMGEDICRVCDSNLWVLLVILVFLISGIVLVIGLFHLQLTISTELIAGIIFYANIVVLGRVTDELIPSLYSLIYYFIAFMNFDLGPGMQTCFYNGMTITVKTAMQYFFPIYLCFLVLVVALISKYSNKFSNLTMHCSVQVLATLMYLSFSKLVLTVISIFVPAYIHTPNGTLTVWYFDGNVSYWNNTGHVALVLVALLVAIVYIIPFLFWSTFASLLAKNSKRIRKYRNLVDVFHGHYRKGWGWWFGARLWIFLMAAISYILLRGTNLLLFLTLNFSFLASFLLIQVYCKPFRLGIVNALDSLLLTDLLIAEVVNAYCVSSGINPYTNVAIIILLLLVEIMFAVIIVKQFLVKFICGRKVIEKTKCFLLKSFRKKEVSHIKGRDDEDADLREPLLESF